MAKVAISLLLVAALGCGDAPETRTPDPGENAPADSGENAPADSGPVGTGDTGPVRWTAAIVDVPPPGEPDGLRTLTELRWASHAAYERVTFQFDGAAVPGFHIEYIDRPVRQCGSGNPTPIEGDGWLEIRLRDTAAHTVTGEPTIADRESFPDLDNLREVEVTCDFEGEVVVVLGVGSPNRYRAFVLDQPARLAVDIQR